MIDLRNEGFVILNTKTEKYYCGYSTFDKQLRKAKIYASSKKAHEIMNNLNKRDDSLSLVTKGVIIKIDE